ncbi:uncharacterized protein F5891DRAFT_753836 [Suillus fuscotomentosus]|uniref:Uncharacterized protein n=1 Tax=Suillus fuscotomentosus TaxID=1912939 RepID=A0AAD4HNW7_9AGAM|nr:uncharacterized protein F5891DRAFT_753836 [Suillus fuscotomentosus]KAG1904665.1 hypothetical protein F5891DRAFT_753836 [Suillus fuscotomentosus]
MSFNSAALYSCPQTIPSSYQAHYEPPPPRRPRASTMTQDANTQWHRNAQRMPGLPATDNFQPPILSREYLSMWDDVEVQNDWANAAREQEYACQLQVERSLNYKQHARKNKKHKHVSVDTERGRCASIDRKRTRHESVDREQRGRASIDRKRARHESVDHERRGRMSLDRPQERPGVIDHEQERRASVDRERQHRESGDGEQGRRASIDMRYDRERNMSVGRHGHYGSVSRTFPRPPVCAVSFRPPITGPQSRPCISKYVMVPRPPVCAVSSKHPTTPQFRHRKSESATVPRPPVCAVPFEHRTTGQKSHHHDSDSVAFPRPSVCAVSSKPPTTGPQSRHPRRSSFNYATGHDHSDGRQHPVYVLPPTAPAPQIHLPPQQRIRTVSIEAVRRLPFRSPEVSSFEKSKPSGLARFNPFNRLCSATSQKIRRKTAVRA